MPANGHQDETVATDTPGQQALDRARAALRQNQLELAARCCAQALAEEPELAGAIELDAVLACQRGNLEAGLKGFRRLTELQPRSAMAWFNLGKALIETREMKSGLLALEKSLGLDSGHLEARVLLGLAQRDLGHLEAAAGTLEQALEQDPKHVPSMLALGAVHAFREQHTAAAELFRRALRVRPNGPVVHYNLGRSLLALGEPGQAAEHFRSALTVNHHYLEARLGLGEAAEALEQWDEALSHYRRVVRRHPDYPPAADRLFSLLISRNRTGEARVQLEQIQARRTHDPHVDLWEARILAAEGREGSALKCLEALAGQQLSESLTGEIAAELARLRIRPAAD